MQDEAAQAGAGRNLMQNETDNAGIHQFFSCELTVGRASSGCTPKGAYSPRGRFRHLLETPFSEPLLRTLPRTLFYCKTHIADPLLRTLLRTLPQNPFPSIFSEPFLERCVLPYDPLGVHPKVMDAEGATEQAKRKARVWTVYDKFRQTPTPYQQQLCPQTDPLPFCNLKGLS